MQILSTNSVDIKTRSDYFGRNLILEDEMKHVLLVALLGITSLIGQISFASAPSATLSLCPQSGDNDVNAFHTTILHVDSGSVNLSSGGSEPNFSSEIQWDANGVVTLVRTGKATITLGQGIRPDKNSSCGVFPFQVSDAVQLELHSTYGIPHPVFSPESGWTVVHPRNDTIVIKSGSETISFVGNHG